MRTKLVIAISILIVMLIAIPVSFAGENDTVMAIDEKNILSSADEDILSDDYYFDSSVENDTGNGTMDNPYKELSFERMPGDSVIHLASGEYNLNSDGSIYNVTIIGESASNTIVKNAAFSISNSLTLINVTFIDSSFNNYDIFNSKDCIFSNSPIMNYATLTAFNSTFENSTSPLYGGAIVSQATVVLDRCTFSNNAAQVGGAIYTNGGSLNINDSLFINNYAEMFGGAIASVSSTLNVSDIKARNNKADGDGGAVYSMYGIFILNNSYFTNNTANNGAGIFVNEATYNIIVNNNFTSNNVFNRARDIYSFFNSNSTIENNSYSGGDALYETFEINMFLGNGNYTLYNYEDIEITDIPSRYNLNELGYVTSVKDQGSNGNCWAFATMATLESNILKALGDNLDLSESNVKNLFGLYGDYGWTYETNKGGIASMGYNYLISWLGPVLEEDDPYILNSLYSKIFNSIMHVQNVLFIQRTSLNDTQEIKKIIMTYGAIYSQIYAQFRNSKQYYSGGINANHAISIVGWDDDMEFSGAPGKGGWIIKNSWGPGSGVSGYYYASYYDTSCLPIGKTDAAFVFILNDTIKYDKNYQYDIQGKSDFFLNSSDTVWYKNIFTATDNEYLAAVSTIFEKETDYTFSIYLNNEFKLSQSGFSKPGYYTFNLNELIPLKIGDVFEIVFKINVSSQAGVPISEKVSFNKYYYTSNTSFLSYDGENWTDFYELKWEYTSHTYNSQVACIKAFTVYDMINTTLKLEIEITNEENVMAIVLNQYNRPVTGGTVTFTVNGEKSIVSVVNGIASFKLLNLDEYNISAVYNNTGYISSQDNILHNNSLLATSINITVNQHNPVDIVAEVFNQEGYPVNYGNVTFNVDGEFYTVNITDYKAVLTHIFKNIGQQNISVVFNGIYNFNTSSAQKSFNVSLINTNLTLTVDNDYYPTNITVTVTDEYNNTVEWGNVTFKINNKDYTVNVVGGKAEFIHNFDIGFNEIIAVYNGLYIYNSSDYRLNITVKPTVISKEEIKTLNGIYEFKLLDNDGNPLKNTNVSVIVKSKTYRLTTDEEGVAGLTVEWAPATYTIQITNPITGEVKYQNIKVLAKITENKDLISYYDAGKYYKVKVLDDDGSIAKGVKVKFTLNGKTYFRTTDNKGYASVKISLKPGKYTVTAEYDGFKVSDKITVKTTLITKNKSFKKGKTIKFTAKLLNSKGKILKNKKVTFKFKGKTYKIKTSSKGIATLKITKKYKIGKYTIYTKYDKLTVKNTIKIKK